MALEKKVAPTENFSKLSDSDIEQRLWQRAEEAAQQRTQLTVQQQNLYEEIDQMKKRNLNLHEKDQLALKEGAYWSLSAALEKLTVLDTAIETGLLQLSDGSLDKRSLGKILPPQKSGPMLSKRKRRILEERERLAKLNKEHFITDVAGVSIPETRHLNTGRHATGIKGNFDTLGAADEFFYRTTDTHGGKVGYGKDGRTLPSKSGKRIRKK